MAYYNPDDQLVVLFRPHTVYNEAKSLVAGRDIYDDLELCEVRCPGSRDIRAFPATAFSHWSVNPETGRQVEVTYAERFSRQYKQFRAKETQTKAGTPLDHAPFLTAARCAELRALNVYTVEQLAHIDGQELKNLGPNGREFKNQAIAYIEQAKAGAAPKALVAELEALRARNEILEEDQKLLKSKLNASEAEFEDMSLDALREYIQVNTGTAVQGTPNRRTLIRMAMDCRPNSKAA